MESILTLLSRNISFHHYTYLLHFLHQVNLTWNDHNSTLTFYNQRWWHFQPDMSVGSIGDNITSINPVIAVSYPFFRSKLINLVGRYLEGSLVCRIN